MLSIKTKLTLKSVIGIYFLKILISFKKLLEMYLIFSVMEHVENKIQLSCILENARPSLFVHCLSVLIVSEKMF